jgi:hypothetical protein
MKIPKIDGSKTVIRETALEVRGVPLVVALRARMISIRPKGTHEWFAVDYETLYDYVRKRDALLKLDARRSA